MMLGSFPGGLLSTGVGKGARRGQVGSEAYMAARDARQLAWGMLGLFSPCKHCAGVHGPQVCSGTGALLQDRLGGGGDAEPQLPKPGIGAVLLPEIQLGSTHCLQRKVQ